MLDIKAIGRRGCRGTRKILQTLNSDLVICFCPKHGEIEHRLYNNGRTSCKACLRIFDNKRRGKRVWTDHSRNLAKLARRRYRATSLGKYVNRMRSVLHQCSVGRISFSRDLPYDAKQLCEHLESIRYKQNNKCPICQQSYGKVKDSIDHIVPIRTATTKDELIILFALSNLSLLCLGCNSAKGARI